MKCKSQPNFYNIIGESMMLVSVNNKRRTVTEGVYTTLALILNALEMTFFFLAIKSIHKMKDHMYLIRIPTWIYKEASYNPVCVYSVVYLYQCRSAIHWRTAQVLFQVSWGKCPPGMCLTVNQETPMHSCFND